MRKIFILTLISLLIPGIASAGVSFGFINAVKKKVDEIDKKVKNQTPNLVLLTSFGGTGSGNGQFIMNDGVSNGGVFHDGTNLYVIDQKNYRIQKFDLNNNFVAWLGAKSATYSYYTVGVPDTSGMTFGFGAGLFVDNSGNVFGGGGYTIWRFNSAGSGKTVIGGSYGSIAIDSLNRIIAYAALGDSIKILNQAGTVLTTFGGTGSSDGKFNNSGYTGQLVVDSSDNIYATDTGNSRIQKFDSNGVFLAKWSAPVYGWSSIAIDTDNNLYTSTGDDLRKYSTNGVLLGTWSGASCSGGCKIAVRNHKFYCVSEFSNTVFIYSIP